MNPHVKDFLKLFSSLYRRHDVYTAWSDFLTCPAIAFRQAVDYDQDREDQYLSIMGKYNRTEIDTFPKLCGTVVKGLEHEKCDFLGSIFHELEMHNKYKGQYFTPYHLSKMCAQGILAEPPTDRIITVQEPACGSGAMVIALCDVAWELGINYQSRMFFHCIDVDYRCFYMAYIQLTLLGIPAVVSQGDSLRWEFSRHWPTAMYVMSGMCFMDLFGNREISKNDVQPADIEVPRPEEKHKPAPEAEQLNLFGEVA